MDASAYPCTVEPLHFEDEHLETLALPGGDLVLTRGVGSGLSRAPDDPPGRVWAVGDRGPNLKVRLAVDRYGLRELEPLASKGKAKIMPRPQIGPALAELRVGEDRVEVLRVLPLRTPAGGAFSGRPAPGPEAVMEPAFGLDGAPLPADPDGADTEGVAAMPGGGFWVSEEYGPSLMKVDAAGVVERRWLPAGTAPLFSQSACKVEDVLPRIAARRRLNRGLEALCVSADGSWLYAAFQSSFDGPGREAGFARIWKIDAGTGEVAAQYLYPFDPPESFLRDRDAGPVEAEDLKVCETVWLGPDRLLVLERVTASARIYQVDLSGCEAPAEHLLETAHPALEEMSGEALAMNGARLLEKTLVFDTDRSPKVCADLEGMALLSPTELLLVNDNDFGVEGAPTRFYRLRFERPLT